MVSNNFYKVLVIAYYYPPMGLSGVQRTLKFTKYLSDFNWQPTVLTTGKTMYYAHDLSLLQEAEKANVRIVRTEGFDINSVFSRFGTVKMPWEIFRKLFRLLSQSIFIPDNKKSWAKKAQKVAESLLSKEKFDIIFVSIPPFSSFSVAAKLKKKFDVPLIVDYRDLWFGNHFTFYPTPYHKYRHKKLESIALKSADRIVAVNRKIKEKLIQTYPFLNHHSIVMIPHGYDEDDFHELRNFKTNNRKLRITYSGIFYESITPKYLFKAFKKLLEERPDVGQNIEFFFVGYFRKENAKLVRKYGLEEYVTEIGYLNHRDSVKQLLFSDILWAMLGDNPNIHTVSLGKIFEYIGSRKPIFATVPDGATKIAAEEYGASFITDYNNIEQIKSMFIHMYSLYCEGKLPTPNEEFVRRHERKYLTEQLVKHFQFFTRDV